MFVAVAHEGVPCLIRCQRWRWCWLAAIGNVLHLLCCFLSKACRLLDVHLDLLERCLVPLFLPQVLLLVVLLVELPLVRLELSILFESAHTTICSSGTRDRSLDISQCV